MGGGLGGHPTMTPGSGTLGACDLPQMLGDLSQTWKHLRSLPSHLEILHFFSGQWPPQLDTFVLPCFTLSCVMHTHFPQTFP